MSRSQVLVDDFMHLEVLLTVVTLILTMDFLKLL